MSQMSMKIVLKMHSEREDTRPCEGTVRKTEEETDEDIA